MFCKTESQQYVTGEIDTIIIGFGKLHRLKLEASLKGGADFSDYYREVVHFPVHSDAKLKIIQLPEYHPDLRPSLSGT